MILMPYYGIKMDKDIVRKNQNFKNTITVNAVNEYFFAVSTICETDVLLNLKELNLIKLGVNSASEVLIKEKNQTICQNLIMSEEEFFVTIIDY